METSGAKSLAFLAQKACIKYLKRINDIGECPYNLIRPVLMKLENPEQLHQLEINSPQIIGHDSEIWLHFIKRDIPDWENKPHQPRNPKKWWEVYKKLKEQTQKDRDLGAQKLKAALESSKEEKEQNLAKLVSRKNLPKEPTNNRARTLWNYNSGKTGSRSKLSMLEKIRKESRDARLARVNVPASQLLKKPTQVTKAPPSLVEDLKREAQHKSQVVAPPIKPPGFPRAPRPPLAIERRKDLDSDDLLEEREQRLRSLARGHAPNPSSGTDSTKKVKVDPEQARNLSTATSTKSPSSELKCRPQKQQIAQIDGINDDQDPENQSTAITPTRPPPKSVTPAADISSNTTPTLILTSAPASAAAAATITSSTSSHRPTNPSVSTHRPSPSPSPHPIPRPRLASSSPQPRLNLKQQQKRKLEEPSMFMKAGKRRIKRIGY